jgi:exopolysaccharide production protein ExoQ
LDILSRRTEATGLEFFLTGLIFLYFLGPHIAFSAVTGPANILSYVILVWLVAPYWNKIVYTTTLNPLPILFLLITVASVLWSALPDITSLEVRAAVRSTVFGSYLAMRYRPKEMMDLLGWVVALGAIFSLIAGVLIPQIAIEEIGWAGIFAYKNMLSSIMVIGMLLFLHRILFSGMNRSFGIVLFLLNLLLLLLSQGKTALATFLIALCLFLIPLLVKTNYKLQMALYFAFILIGGAAIILLTSNLESIIVDGLGKDLEFNGRVPIWQLMIEQGLKRPLTGYGYAAFWTSDTGLFVVGQSWAAISLNDIGFRFNAHNSYVDTFLQTGLVGLFLYLGSIGSAISGLVKLLIAKHDISNNLWMLQVLIAMVLMNLADSFGGISPSSQWSLFVYIALSAALQQSRLKRQPNESQPSPIYIA